MVFGSSDSSILNAIHDPSYEIICEHTPKIHSNYCMQMLSTACASLMGNEIKSRINLSHVVFPVLLIELYHREGFPVMGIFMHLSPQKGIHIMNALHEYMKSKLQSTLIWRK